MWRNYLWVNYHPLRWCLLVITLTLHLPDPSGITFPPVSLLPYVPYHTFLMSSCIWVLHIPSSTRMKLWVSRPLEPAFASGHLLWCVQAIRFLGSVSTTACHLVFHGTSSSPSWWCPFFLWSASYASQWTFEGQHYVHLPAPTVVEQLTMSGERIKMPKRGVNWVNSKFLAIIKLYT